MPKIPEVIRPEDLPWDAPPPRDPYERIEAMRRRHIEKHQPKNPSDEQQMVDKVSSVIEIIDKGGLTVHKWLPRRLEALKRLDALVTKFHLTGKDDFSKTFYQKVKERFAYEKITEFFGPEVQALLVILFRQSLYKETRDPLMVLSDPEGNFTGILRRKYVVVAAAVLDNITAFDDIVAYQVSPAVGQWRAEEISSQLLRQVEPDRLAVLVFKAGRRKLRLSEPMK